MTRRGAAERPGLGHRHRRGFRAGWRRWLACLLLGQVLAGTLVPMVQAAPIFDSIFDVLSGDFCAPPEDSDAPARPHRDHAHCILCISKVGPALVELALPPLLPAPSLARHESLSQPAVVSPDGRHFAAKGCRGPPTA